MIECSANRESIRSDDADENDMIIIINNQNKPGGGKSVKYCYFLTH